MMINRLLIAAIVTSMWACEGGCIIIGVIANGTDGVTMQNVSADAHNVSLVIHHIDTSEVYNIFKSIQRLDADTDVDVIVLFDYDPAILRMSSVLQTNNKKLIRWGERKRNNQQEKDASRRYIDPGDICGEEVLLDITTEDPYCQTDLNTTFQYRDDKLITLLGPQALTFLVNTLSWKSVFVFYETSTEIETSDFVDALSQAGVLFALVNVDHVTDLHELLQTIYQRNVPANRDINIIVLCQFYCARKVFRTANTFDYLNLNYKTLLNKYSKWLVAVYGYSQGVSRALQACADDLDNVAIIAIPEFSGNGMEEFHKILNLILLNIIKEEIGGAQLDLKWSLIDRLEARAATWSPTSKCLAYNIDTLLWMENGRYFNSIGYIEINGNVLVKSDIFPNSKYGFNKRQFLVSTLSYPPFVKKREVNNTVIYEGFCMDLLAELAHILNFTYILTEPEDKKWGTYSSKENMTFNGLVGQLQREEVDIVVAPISNQPERSEVMDFSFPFYYEYTTVVTKIPDVDATKWRTLVDPLKWEVLVFIGIALPAVTILAFLLEKYNPFYDVPRNAEGRERNGGLHTWHSSFWYMYGALLCQGGVHLPDSIAGRTLVSFWWLFCIIIVGIYSGNLIAFLTVTKEKPPFNTLAELAQLQGTYEWGTLSGTHWEIVFLTSRNPTYKAIGDGLRTFNRTDPDVLNPNPDIHIKKVKKGNYAWIGDKTYIETAMSSECSLIAIKEEFMPMKYALGFMNNSPYAAVFSKQIMQIHEGGLYQIWKRKWWPKANFCAGNTVTEAKPISLMDVQSAFYVCFIGIFFGCIAITIEFIVFKFRFQNHPKTLLAHTIKTTVNGIAAEASTRRTSVIPDT